MKSRVLPILNAIGCLALSAVVVIQWRREHTLDLTLTGLRGELATANEAASTEKKHATDLERDIAVLKESLKSAQQALEPLYISPTKEEIQNMIKLAQTWQTALAARDEKLRALDAELTATRLRLVEAIAKLKASSAR